MARAATSAGLLPFRRRDGGVEVLVAHMGGPWWARRDAGAWTVIKGEHDETEAPLDAARREFVEETGLEPPDGEPIPLGTVRQTSGKRVTAWAVEGDLDAAAVRSQTFDLEWPRGSGRILAFPEIDRAAWLDLATARAKLVPAQAALVDALERHLAERDP